MNPIPYSPSFEKPEDNEAETSKELMETMRSISEITYGDDPTRALRSVHAKNSGILKGRIKILSDLPQELTQGVFKQAKEYDVIMRFSTAPGDLLDDKVSTSRGLGFKITGIEGDKLPGTDGDYQNLVLVNGPTFLTPTAGAFLSNLKLLATTTNKTPQLKEILSAGLQKVEEVLEAAGHPSAKIMSMGGHPENHILGETFYSEVPYMFGPYMAKFSIAPVSSKLTELTKKPLDMEGRENPLRESVHQYFAVNEAEWEFRVQLCKDIEKMPIEDPTVEWPEDISPYITVARITVPVNGDLDDSAAEKEEGTLSFNPWHGLVEHRPLGSINRARKASYDMSAEFRAQRNKCPYAA